MARPSIAKTPFSQRLTAVREALGYKERKAFAVKLGMHPETLGGYERGDNFPDQAFLLRYKQEFSVNIDWLVTGEGEMFASPASFDMQQMIRRMTTTSERFGFGTGEGSPPLGMVAIPLYEEVAASAGPGATAPFAPTVSSMVAFDPAFLREKGAVPDRCSVINARGDSMSPTIPDGSLLIVDHSQTQISNGYIMVINLGDDLLVKRVRRRLDGLVDLISDNQAYAPETIGPDTLQQLRVVGRVVYFCRTP